MMEVPKQEKNENRERNIDKIFALRHQSGKELFTDKLEYLPPYVKEMVLGRVRRLERYGKLSPTELKAEQMFMTNEAYKGLVDSRFNLPNKVFAKTEIVKHLDNLFSQEKPKESDFKKIGRLSFDLDGLKAINDLTGSHEKGDKYLRMVADIFKDEELTDDLRGIGIESIVSVDGGDEFGIILKADFDLSARNQKLGDSAINYVVEKIKEKVNGLKINNLIDFNNPKIKSRFEEMGIKVPENYELKASISGGGATLFEGLSRLDLGENASYEQFLDGIMGNTLEESDLQMNLDKKNGIKKLENSDKSEEKFNLIVRSRNEEEMRLRIELEKSKTEIVRLKGEISK